MHIAREMDKLNAIAAGLPFELDDVIQVNHAFRLCRRNSVSDSKRHLQIWTYCYVRRYFLTKYAREDGFLPSDCEALVTKAYRKIITYGHTVGNHGSYAQWVSKLCKNTFLNHTRLGRQTLPLDENCPRMAFEPVSTFGDFSVLARAVASAVDRLPEFLRDVARMRFIERCSYEEIGAVTGKPLPIVRSYTSKAIARFRADKILLALVESTLEPVRNSVSYTAHLD